MKHYDLNKVKRGDLWVRKHKQPGDLPYVVLNVEEDALTFYIPEGTHDWTNVSEATVLGPNKARCSNKLVQLNAAYFYFVG